jgi:cyanophycin synthetase
MAGPGSAQMILKNPAIDFAVLETARGGIVRSGLGFDRCDVAVVTNISSDHLGLGGVETIEDLARIKAVVPEAVFRDGASVLNADNEWTVRMAERARGEIIYFSMDPENPVVQDHLRERGRAVVLQQTAGGEMITLLDGKAETSLLWASEIPATMEGRLRVNIANALAATAAAIARDVQVECIRDALRAFTTDFTQTPGRFNLLEIEGRQVVMDYGHNVGALEAVGDFVQRTSSAHSVGVIGVPGDRRNEDAWAFARLAAQIFDEIIVREDANLRGRSPGEMATLLREALQEAGKPPAQVHTVLDEIDAIQTAIDLAAPGDLVVALVEKITPTWNALRQRQIAHGAPTRTGSTSPPLIPRHVPEPVAQSATPAIG